MEQFTNKTQGRYRGASIGVFDPGEVAENIFGKQYNDSFYATACAYLLRRFGPSHRGCDPYKELTAYSLTTEMDGVVLTVRPCCSVRTSFGYLLNAELYENTLDAMFKDRRENKTNDIKKCEVRDPVALALFDAMKELQKPVNVRDWYFNIVGMVKDSDLQISEDGDSVVSVEYSDLAGYGITPDYFDEFTKDK